MKILLKKTYKFIFLFVFVSCLIIIYRQFLNSYAQNSQNITFHNNNNKLSDVIFEASSFDNFDENLIDNSFDDHEIDGDGEDKFLKGVAIASFQAENGPDVIDKNSDWYKWISHPVDNMVNGDKLEDSPGLRNQKNLIKIFSYLENTCINSYRFNFEWSRLFPDSTADIEVNYEKKNGLITKVDITENMLQELDNRVNKKALMYYENLLILLKEKRIEPVATLNHFTLPIWLHNPHEVYNNLNNNLSDIDLTKDIKAGGWLHEKTVIEFAKFSAYVAWKFGDKIKYWFTLNEPLTILTGYLKTVPNCLSKLPFLPEMPQESFPPGIFISYEFFQKIIKNLISAHVTSYEQLRRFGNKNNKIGIVINTVYFVPVDPDSVDDMIATKNADYLYNRFFLNAVINGWYDENLNKNLDHGETIDEFKEKVDILGINYYMRQWIEHSLLARTVFSIKGYPSEIFNFLPLINKCLNCSDFMWDIYPQGLKYQMEDFWQLYQVPMMITENGISDATDKKRQPYLQAHIQIVEELRYKIPIIGYMQWTLIDNFEWAFGFSQKYGLMTYSFDENNDINIKLKDSFYFYSCRR